MKITDTTPKAERTVIIELTENELKNITQSNNYFNVVNITLSIL
jgi:hypothetical protein